MKALQRFARLHCIAYRQILSEAIADRGEVARVAKMRETGRHIPKQESTNPKKPRFTDHFLLRLACEDWLQAHPKKREMYDIKPLISKQVFVSLLLYIGYLAITMLYFYYFGY